MNADDDTDDVADAVDDVVVVLVDVDGDAVPVVVVC